MSSDDPESSLKDDISNQPTGSSPVPTPAPQRPGTDFGTRYRIISRLGEGGMGLVYHAYDKDLQREVALKIIRSGIADNPTVIERFRREILLASRVTHKNVLRIHDLGEVNGVKFISMQYIKGNDLAKIIAREGALPPDRVASILTQLCHGMKAAHEEGVLHRDLKPQNVMIDEKDNVYIMDFGLARSLQTTPEPSLTGFGEAMGTPMYMSPEQLKGDKPDQRADIYSLGLVIYQMLTGKLPFSASPGFGWVMERMKSGPKDPKQLNPALPDYLSAIVRKCTENNPDFRYQSEAEILQDLELRHVRWSSKSLVARAAPSRSKLVGAALFLLIALGAWLIFRGHGPGVSPDLFSGGVAFLPLENGTSDPNSDWIGMATMEGVQSEFREVTSLPVVSNDRIYQTQDALGLFEEKRPPNARIKEIADHLNADVVVSGKFFQDAGKLRVEAMIQEIHEGKSIPVTVMANGLPDLVSGLSGKLSEQINVSINLSDKERKAISVMLTRPAAVLNLYYQALKLHYKNEDAKAAQTMERVVKQDPRFGFAHFWLGRFYLSSDQDDLAQKHMQTALSFVDDLPRYDHYHLLAIQSTLQDDEKKVVQAYKQFQELYPKSREAYAELGSFLYGEEKWGDAVTNYQKAHELDPRSVDLLTEFGRAELKNANPQTALKYLTDAQTLSKEFRTDTQRADLLNVLGYAYMQLDYNQTALEHFQKSMEIKQRIGDKKGMATTLSNIGLVYRSMNRYEDAKQSYEQALVITKDLDDKKTMGRILNNLGFLAEKYARLDEALDYYTQGLTLARLQGSHSEIANRLNNIGFIYYLKGRYTDAATYFELGLQEIKDSDRMIRGFLLLATGDLFMEQAKYSRALDSFQEALKIWRNAQNDTGLAYILMDIAHTYDLLGNSAQAEKYFTEAQKVADDIQDKEVFSYLYVHRCQFLRRQGQLQPAETLIIKASQNAVEDHNQTPISISNLEMGALYNEMSHPDRSFGLLQKTVKETETLGLKPLSVYARIELARAHQLQTRPADALRELQTAISQATQIGLSEALLQGYSLSGLIYESQGKTVLALKQYEEALTTVNEMRKEMSKTDVNAFLQRKDIRELIDRSAKSFKAAGQEHQFVDYTPWLPASLH